MIPDDDRMRDAMHRIESSGPTAGTDAPDLFERVTAGARRRRRRVVSGASVAAAAAVVAAVAIVPAVTGNSHHASRTTTAAAPLAPATVMPAPLPHFVTPPATSPVSGSAHSVVPPSGPIVLPVLPSSPASPPLPLATDSAGCPTEASLAPGPNAAALAEAAAVAAAPRYYGVDEAAKAHVTKVYAASTGKGYGIAADGMCGKALGDNSYVVEFNFGDTDSASMGGGQLFLADFPSHGWQVWFQYH